VAAWIAAHAPRLRMIMQVHDELVFEGPQAELRARAPELADRMCRVSQLAVPLVADWGVGANWDEAHTSQGHASSAQKPA
jgi:DNA polymerase-1